MSRIVIIGAGGHGRVIADIARCCGHDVAALVSAATGAEVAQAVRDQNADAAFIAIGFNPVRERVQLAASAAKVSLATLVHPFTAVADGVVMGAGSAVMPGAVVGPGAQLGAGVVVNTNASVDHDCILGDFVSVSPGAALGGTVRVGARSWIGIGATVIHGITVGEDSVVAAGAALVSDLPSLVMAMGVPGRIRRRRDRDERYL